MLHMKKGILWVLSDVMGRWPLLAYMRLKLYNIYVPATQSLILLQFSEIVQIAKLWHIIRSEPLIPRAIYRVSRIIYNLLDGLLLCITLGGLGSFFVLHSRISNFQNLLFTFIRDALLYIPIDCCPKLIPQRISNQLSSCFIIPLHTGIESNIYIQSLACCMFVAGRIRILFIPFDISFAYCLCCVSMSTYINIVDVGFLFYLLKKKLTLRATFRLGTFLTYLWCV